MSSIKRNSFYGFLGFAIPTLVVLVAYPVLVKHLGADKFGVYILATSISGTLAFLDFGFSSATLKFVAEDLAKDDKESAAEVLITSVWFYGFLGTFIALIIWLFSPQLVSVFSVKDSIRNEAIWTFRLAALQFAVFFLTTVFLSLFKGLQKFNYSSLTLSFLSILSYGGTTLGVILIKVDLIGVTFISLLSNIIVLVISIFMGFRLCKIYGISLLGTRPSWKSFRRMFQFGSIMTINSISGFLLYQIQRYLIGGMLDPSAVTIYQLAFTLPAKAHSIVYAVTEVMFPFASAVNAIKDYTKLRQVYLKMLFGSLASAIGILIPICLFSNVFLPWWVGAEIGVKVAPLIPVFSLAYIFLAVSPAPFQLINGIGKPWYNTIFYFLNAICNILFIVVLSQNGVSLMAFAWAFALANLITAILYQVAVEVFIWHRWLLIP